MKLDEFFRCVGGDYGEAKARFQNDERIVRFLNMFPGDDSMQNLTNAMNAGDTTTAFRAVHTLKGVAQNLGFDRLYAVSVPLTEAMRGAKPLDDFSLLAAVQTVQAETLAAIAKLDDTP